MFQCSPTPPDDRGISYFHIRHVADSSSRVGVLFCVESPSFGLPAVVSVHVPNGPLPVPALEYVTWGTRQIARHLHGEGIRSAHFSASPLFSFLHHPDNFYPETNTYRVELSTLL